VKLSGCKLLARSKSMLMAVKKCENIFGFAAGFDSAPSSSLEGD
jgi:hypothetical protein